MARHQQQLLAVAERGSVAGLQGAVLIRGAGVTHPLPLPHGRRAGIEGQRLQPGVGYGPPRPWQAHHRRQHEEAVLEAAAGQALRRLVAGIVGVQEDVGAGLQFGENAGFQIERQCAGAAAADHRTGQAGAGEQLGGLGGEVGGPAHRGPPLFYRPDVLSVAVIGLEAAELETGALRHLGCENPGRLSRRDPASLAADLDLDQHAERDTGRHGRRAQLRDIAPVVDADRETGLAGERRQARDLASPHHLIADHNVGHAAGHQDFRLADLLAAHADRAMGHLLHRDLRRLVGLGVGPQAHRPALERTRHAFQIAFVGVEVDQQRRGFDLVQALADGGRASLRHGFSLRLGPPLNRDRFAANRGTRQPPLREAGVASRSRA